jgi:hypothetical protein
MVATVQQCSVYAVVQLSVLNPVWLLDMAFLCPLSRLRVTCCSVLFSSLSITECITTNITTLAAQRINDRAKCQHGKVQSRIIGYDSRTGSPIKQSSCVCDEGWRMAGITDTIHFLEGECTQYECTSDEKCKEATGAPEATCPVPGWNCECPFSYALMSSLMGYETYSNGNSGIGAGGRCMGILYYLSVHGLELCARAFEQGWLCFLVAAGLMVPFGRRRMCCTHRRHSLTNVLMRLCGYNCHGNCTNHNTFMDDFAWSIYALQWMVWYHIAVFVAWATCMWIWCVAVWLMVAVIIICFLIVAAVAALCGLLGVGGDGCSGDCGDCKCCECSCGDANVECAYCGGCSSSGPNGDTSEWCGCCSKACHPLIFVITMLPTLPQNLWGGILGHCLGTHAGTGDARAYHGGSCLIDALAFRCWQADAYDDEAWRDRLLGFFDSGVGTHVSVTPQQATMGRERHPVPYHAGTRPLMESSRDSHVKVIVKNGSFDLTEDSCVENTFHDYTEDTCWICREDNIRSHDRYVCGHIFCTSCSQQMLARRMPCPLCRSYTALVLRSQQ